MWIFSRKPEIGLGDYCRDYYWRYILYPVSGVADNSEAYMDAVRSSVVEADASFSSVTTGDLMAATMPLLVELFALAWLDKFGDRSAVQQSTFTKSHLQEMECEHIWQEAERYNQAVALSVTGDRDPNKTSGRFSIVFITGMRAGLFKDYVKAGHDPEAVSRVLNRLLFASAWRVTIPVKLSFILTEGLGFPLGLNDEAGFRLTAVILGFYKDARQRLNEVRIRR